MKKVGLFGGTFDPIHRGHTALAQLFMQQLHLDEVWFMVTPQNPWKRSRNLSPDDVRLEMVRLAVKDIDGLKASDYEFHLEKPSFTYQTLRHLRNDYPNTEFTLLIGADNWQGWDKWAEHDEILSHHDIAVFPREGCPIDPTTLPDKVTLLDAPLFNVSSTEIREKIAAGMPIDNLVAPEVEAYIMQWGMYSPPSPPKGGV